MNRNKFLVATVLAFASPSTALASRGGGYKSIPYEPRDTKPYFKPGRELIRHRQGIDPKIRATVLKINESGWVWTAESCQGDHVWSSDPMLRLVCQQKDAGRMLRILFGSSHSYQFIHGESEIRLLNHGSPPNGWFETRVFIRHPRGNSRDGRAVFRRFAERIQ